MPFPMPPLAMTWTGCTEYIPGGAKATELEHSCVERHDRGAQGEANGRSGGEQPGAWGCEKQRGKRVDRRACGMGWC